jgi:hypothetical protein
MTIIICAFCAIIQLPSAMDANNPAAWTNWLSIGFCLGLMTSSITDVVVKSIVK